MRDCNRYYDVTEGHLSSCFCKFWHSYSTLTHKQIYRGRSDFILESASCAVVLSCGRPYIRPEHKPTSSTVKNAEYNFWMPKKYFPTSQCGFEEGGFQWFCGGGRYLPCSSLTLIFCCSWVQFFVPLCSVLPAQPRLSLMQYLVLCGLKVFFLSVWCFLDAPILDLGLGTDCVEVSYRFPHFSKDTAGTVDYRLLGLQLLYLFIWRISQQMVHAEASCGTCRLPNFVLNFWYP